MKQGRIIFRVDATAVTGMGHLARCMAMAEMLKGDFETLFVCANPAPAIIEKIRNISEVSVINPDGIEDDCSRLLGIARLKDILVLDGYSFTENYQQRIREKNLKFVYIDDLATGFYFADVIINHSEGLQVSDYKRRPDCSIYLGLRYAMLRKSFFLNGGKKITGIKKVFLSMGASDINNLSEKFINVLIGIVGITEIHMLAGSLNKHLPGIKKFAEAHSEIVKVHIDLNEKDVCDLIRNSDLAICASGNVALECCAVGIPLLIGLTAPNQNGIYGTLIEKGAAAGLGDITMISENEIARKLAELFGNKNYLQQMPREQKKLIDGKSPDRIRKIVNELFSSELSFRYADGSDINLYFNWTNDQLVRSNSFNQQPVKFDDHRKWFLQKLDEEKCRMFVFYDKDLKPAGQVRIDESNNETVIGISIDKTYRGKSLGKEMLIRACRSYFYSFPDAVINAYIKQENIPSIRIFGQAGFKDSEELIVNGMPCVKLKKSNDE